MRYRLTECTDVHYLCKNIYRPSHGKPGHPLKPPANNGQPLRGKPKGGRACQEIFLHKGLRFSPF